MTDDAHADIAWMRQLAEDGARQPFRGASIVMAAGLIYGLASLAHWAALTGVLPGGVDLSAPIWLGATALFLVTLAILIWRLKAGAGVQTTANRVIGAVWSCVGWAIFALFISLAAYSARLSDGQGVAALYLAPSIIMVFYGLGWAVTASLFRNGRLWWLSIGSFIAAPALAALTGAPEQYLGYAAALFVLMALPGFLLMRQAAKAS